MKYTPLIAIAAVLTVAVGGLWFANQTTTPERADDGRLTVATSIYTLDHFAQQVGRDLITISHSTPSGIDAHDYEPTAQDITAIYESDVFLFHGAGVDAWAEDIAADVAAAGVTVIEMTEHFDLHEHGEEEHEAGEVEEHEEADHEDEDQHSDEEHGHNHDESDPHIWMDPVLAAEEVDVIVETLSTVDPNNAAAYAANGAAYQEDLETVDNNFAAGLANCSRDTIVVAHDAYAYLTERYNIKTVAISGLSPDSEPSTKRLAEIADLVTEQGMTHIFFDSLVNSGLSETIAEETGAQTIVLNPLEGLTTEQATAGKTYVTLMGENLTNLRTALDCK